MLISIMPCNTARIFFYRFFRGYDISFSSKIGFGTLIHVKSAVIRNAGIGRFNRFTGPFHLLVESGVNIGSTNSFVCLPGKDRNSVCRIGERAHITEQHLIDATGGFTLGESSRIAGRGSQFWTHGGQRSETAIAIQEKCYIGSAVRITQGVNIPENTYVGLGSVVVDSFDEPGTLIFGNPAKVVKKGITARKSLTIDN